MQDSKPNGTLANTNRPEGVPRLSSLNIDSAHDEYLVYRTLFSDLEKATNFAHGRLLDIGCGNKPYRGMFAGKVTAHVGCDVVQSSQNQVDIICPATKLDFENSSFDTVLLTQVIEHVAETELLMSECFRVLRAGGTLIISGPMYWPLHEEPYDFYRFTEHGFRYVVEKVGFQGFKNLNTGGKWALCGQVLIHTLYGTRLHKRWLVKAINFVFSRLDDTRAKGRNPMNYVVVANKPN